MIRFDAGRFDAEVGPGWAPLRYVDRVDSTQTMLRDAPDPRWTWRAASADLQSAGRGRSGAAWIATPNCALLITIATSLNLPIACWPRASLIAGLGAVQWLDDIGAGQVRLKWPNDLMVLDQKAGAWRKLGGILCERVEHAGTAPSWLCGIGLNLRPSPDWSAALAARSTSLGDLGLGTIGRTQAAIGLCRAIRTEIEQFAADAGRVPARRLGERLAFVGCEVQLDLGREGQRWVHLDGVDETGALQVRPCEPTTETLAALPLALIAARSKPPWHALGAATEAAPRTDA